MLPRVEPIIPKLVKELPRGQEWLYELKLYGFRGTLYVEGSSGRFVSKAMKPMRRFDDLANAIARELGVTETIIDGEIVVISGGVPDFNALMMNRGDASYVAFDHLWLNGRDLRELPLWRRKRSLRKLASETRVGGVEQSEDPKLLEAVVRMDLEGVVAKRCGDVYSRHSEWLKVNHPEYSQKEGRAELFHRRRG